MAETVSISGHFDWQNGDSGAQGSVTFILSGWDIDGDIIIEPKETTVALDENGSFAAALVWPNSRGIKGTTYTITRTTSANGKPVPYAKGVVISESTGTIDLAKLLAAQAQSAIMGVGRVIITTQEDFDAKLASGSLVDGVYLIEDFT